MTTKELIALLQQLDPEGNRPVALKGNLGGTVEPLKNASKHNLYVNSDDTSRATLEDYRVNEWQIRLYDMLHGECIYLA